MGAQFNRGVNAAWLGVEWVNEAHTSDDVAALARELQHHQIRTVFVYASYLKANGQFNLTYAHAPTFTRTLKSVYPALNVQAWLGLPLHHAGNTDPTYHVDLTNAATRMKIAIFCAELLRDGQFDGIHLDPEPVPSEDVATLQLLDEVRQAIGLTPTLSIAARRYWPVALDATSAFGKHIGWGSDYYREVARRVNQIAVMTYDSGLSSPELYQQWMKFQIIAITQAVEGTQVELFFGVPTSEEATTSHWPNAENMMNGLQGVIRGLNDIEAKPQTLTGIAIYPHWETDASEWVTYERVWLGR